MSDSDLFISNGTCYSAAGKKLDSQFIPCGNDAFGHQTCCGKGDNCLADNACFGVYGTGYGSMLTYFGGCTDPDYKDGHCPNKEGIDDNSWIALTLCDNTDVWAACSQKGNPSTLQNGAYCSCTKSEDATVAFTDASSLALFAVLPQSTGGTISFQGGHTPTAPASSEASSTGSGGGSGSSGGGSTPTKTGSGSSSSAGSSAGNSASSSPSGSDSSSGSSSGSSGGSSSTGSGTAAGASQSGDATSDRHPSTGTSSAISPNSGGGGSSSLGSGAKIGIGVGVALAVLVLLLAIILVLLRRRRRQRRPLPSPSETEDGSSPASTAAAAAAASKRDSSEEKQRPKPKLVTPTTPPGIAEADSQPVWEADEGRAPRPMSHMSELEGSPVTPVAPNSPEFVGARPAVDAARDRENARHARQVRESGNMSPVPEVPAW